MNPRTRSIVTFSLYASRPEFHAALSQHAATAKAEAHATYEELYECALQSYLFAGFPAALEAVRALNRAYGVRSGEFTVDFAAAEARIQSEANAYPTYLELGDALYQIVYGNNAPIVKQGLMKLSPELAGWAVTEGYGKTLARRGLDSITRELAIVAMLVQLGWDRQLYSHIIGARNVGAQLGDIKEAIGIGSNGDVAKENLGLTLLAKLG